MASVVEVETAGLMVIATPLERFMDQRGVPHARLPTKERPCVRLNSNAFEVWIAGEYLKEFGQAFTSPQALRATTRALEALAVTEGKTHRLEPRFGTRPDGSIVLDLKDENGRAAVVTAEGWTIDPQGDRFRRPEHMRPLPEPKGGGDLRELGKFINVSQTDLMLLLVYAVLTLFRGIPRPLLLLYGPAGSAKTSAANWLRDLFDPTTARSLAIQTSERELVLAVDQHAVPSFDNVTRFTRNQADALCRVCTGGSFSKRKLRTDEDVILLEFMRPMIVTAINPPTEATDLVDRMVMIELKRVLDSDRKTMTELNAAFDLKRPHFTGAILDAVSYVIREKDKQEHGGNLGRLADYHRLGRVAALALGYTTEDFDAAYQQKTLTQSWTAAEADGVARLIADLLDDAKRAKRGLFEGTATDLLELLLLRAKGVQREALPKTAAALGKRLREIEPVLMQLDIDTSYGKTNRAGRRITLRLLSAVTLTAVTPEAPEVVAA